MRVWSKGLVEGNRIFFKVKPKKFVEVFLNSMSVRIRDCVFRKIGILLMFCLYNLDGLAQAVCPTVPDFMDLHQPWVTATYGNTKDPYAQIGIVEGRHTIISEQGKDINTGRKLAFLPEEISKVIRLGNDKSGGEAESLTYRFIVDRERPVLLLNFAVVLEDPHHDAWDQPRFVMQVLDRNGRLLEACTEYDVSAKEGIEGFHSYLKDFYLPVRWRDWTSVGTDLSAYAGEEVQVRFITYDCELSGHFGYAYFYASCISARLSVHDCKMDGFELAAPDHFASYAWSNGETERISKWDKGGSVPDITCEVISVTGCRFSLYSSVVEPENMPAKDTLIYDTVCEGENYEKHAFKLSSLERSGTFTHTFVDVSDCSATREVTTTLALQVVQKYMWVEDWICEGEDYNRYGFQLQKRAPGNYKDTLQLSYSGRCGSYRVLDLHVASSRIQPRVLVGDVSPCGGEAVTYRTSLSVSGDRYEWEYPGELSVVGNETMPEITVRFPETGWKDTLKLHIINGCGMTEAVLPVTALPAYHFVYKDSTCVGLPFQKYGFQLAPKQETDSYTEIIYAKTVQGCDSIRILNLEVFDVPQVKLLLKDSVFCSPREITLTPSLEKNKNRRVGVGDVLCTDNSVVNVAEYKKGGKVAKGIVFWVDSSGKHGWAVDVWQFPDKLRWGQNPDLPLKRYNMLSDALGDFDGKENTQKVIDQGNAEKYPAIYTVVSREGNWYVPAAGQLDILLVSYPTVNRSLAEVGGIPLTMTKDASYWSSSLGIRDEHFVWTVKIDSGVEFYWDDVSMILPFFYVRGICNF